MTIMYSQELANVKFATQLLKLSDHVSFRVCRQKPFWTKETPVRVYKVGLKQAMADNKRTR